MTGRASTLVTMFVHRRGGVDGAAGARRISDLGIPEGVREVIGRRLSRLSNEANRLLSAASLFD